MTDEELLKLAHAATPGGWWHGHSSTKTMEAAKDYSANAIESNPTETDLWLVGVGSCEEKKRSSITALTGNGPTSRANAEYIAAVSPDVVIALMERVKLAEAALREANEDAYFLFNVMERATREDGCDIGIMLQDADIARERHLKRIRKEAGK